MREIKFRAFYKPLEMMIPNKNIESINFETKVLGIYLPIENRGFHKFRLSDFELLQSTGLKDKNGAEIYEGDLFRTADVDNVYIDIVVWSEIDGSWAFENAHGHCTVLANDINLSHGEVIGNIYEHPHLLGER